MDSFPPVCGSQLLVIPPRFGGTGPGGGGGIACGVKGGMAQGVPICVHAIMVGELFQINSTVKCNNQRCKKQSKHVRLQPTWAHYLPQQVGFVV